MKIKKVILIFAILILAATLYSTSWREESYEARKEACCNGGWEEIWNGCYWEGQRIDCNASREPCERRFCNWCHICNTEPDRPIQDPGCRENDNTRCYFCE